MTKPSDDKSAMPSKLPNEQIEANELSDQALDAVTGGGGNPGTPGSRGVAVNKAADDEAPKETITFEYGALQVKYTPQKSD